MVISGGLGGLVGDVGTKGCVVIFGFSDGFHLEYIAVVICVICCFSWSIFVCREVISASLA